VGGKPPGEGEVEGGYDGDVAEETEVADVLDARWEQGRGAWRSDVWRKSVSGTQWDIAWDLVRMGTLLTESLPSESSKGFRWVESGLAGSFGGCHYQQIMKMENYSTKEINEAIGREMQD